MLLVCSYADSRNHVSSKTGTVTNLSLEFKSIQGQVLSPYLSDFGQHSIHLMPTAKEKTAVTLCCNALAVALNITSCNFLKEGGSNLLVLLHVQVHYPITNTPNFCDIELCLPFLFNR